MTQKEKVIAALHEGNSKHVGILLDALTPEEIREFNQGETGGAARIKQQTGLHVALDRSSGENEFYAWLLAERDFSVNDLLALYDDKTGPTKERIRRLFGEFQKDLMENYSLGPEGAERLGALHRAALEKIADYQLPGTKVEDIHTVEDMAKVVRPIVNLQHMLVDLGQDSSAITADPARRAAYYQGAGGMMSMQRLESRVHGALFGPTYMLEEARRKDEIALANSFAEFKRIWPEYAAKKVMDPGSPDASTGHIGRQEVLHRQMEGEMLANMMGPATQEQREEAAQYLEGLSESRSWSPMMDALREEVTEMNYDAARQEAGDRDYRLLHEPRLHLEGRLAAVGDYQTMTPAQKQEAATLFQEIFAGPLGYSKLESYYAAEETEAYDLFRIDGKSVRELASAAGADKLTPAEKEQFMQIRILQAMKDPSQKLTIDIPQYVEPHVMASMGSPRELTLRQPEIPMRPDFRRPDLDVGALAKQFEQEPFQKGKLPKAADHLGDPFETMVDKLLITEKEDHKVLPRFGKDIYDCVFINGRSVNEAFAERYGDTGLEGDDLKKMKSAFVVSERMNPENVIYVRPFDKKADHLVLQDPIALGVGPEVKGIPEETRRAITERNRQFMEHYYEMTPEERKEAYPSDPVEAAKAEKLRSIDSLYQKMLDGESEKHKNSPEYQAMFNAAKAVHEQMVSPDPDKNMDTLLGDLHKAAETYAEKEAYKSKWTERGVTRKNTAFSLMSLTGKAADEKRIKDTRLHKSQKAKKSFKALLEEERKENDRTYGAKAEKKRREERHAHRQKQDEKKADTKTAGQKTGG